VPKTSASISLTQPGARLRAELSAGVTFGLFLVSGNPVLTEATGFTGADWAVVDLEAGALSRGDALHQVQALSGSPVSPIIRVSSLSRPDIEHALDLGVAGVLIPKVDRVEDAELAAQYTRYPPEGVRGVNAIRAGAYYSQTAEYFANANQQVLCIVQIESREALKNADRIAATPGVDMLFIGANDLAMDLGQPGVFTGAVFDDARETVLAACAAAAKPAGIFASGTKAARQYAQEGFRFIAVGNEVKFFLNSVTLALTMARR
jgi:2-keto-3-deoxy-L-rhamnonate aldolase RhmA